MHAFVRRETRPTPPLWNSHDIIAHRTVVVHTWPHPTNITDRSGASAAAGPRLPSPSLQFRRNRTRIPATPALQFKGPPSLQFRRNRTRIPGTPSLHSHKDTRVRMHFCCGVSWVLLVHITRTKREEQNNRHARQQLASSLLTYTMPNFVPGTVYQVRYGVSYEARTSTSSHDMSGSRSRIMRYTVPGTCTYTPQKITQRGEKSHKLGPVESPQATGKRNMGQPSKTPQSRPYLPCNFYRKQDSTPQKKVKSDKRVVRTSFETPTFRFCTASRKGVRRHVKLPKCPLPSRV